jgi:hypothetical protein
MSEAGSRTRRGFSVRLFLVMNFAWQAGYGAFSLREADVEVVRLYIDRQAAHHASGTTVDGWERIEQALGADGPPVG